MVRSLVKLTTTIVLFTILCSCESDDYVDPVSYAVQVTLDGDVEEFNYTLSLDGYGENINQLINPFDSQSIGSFFQSGDLNTGETYTISASELDGMSVSFSTTEFESSETFIMTISLIIFKNGSPITNFSKSYEKSPSISGITILEFELSNTKDSDTVNCEGNACS